VWKPTTEHGIAFDRKAEIARHDRALDLFKENGVV
jgi:hypothetical protein